MQGFLKLTWVETKLFVRQPGTYIGLFFPVVLVLIIGTIYGNSPTPFFHGRGALDVSLPAYIIMLIVSNAFFSLPITIVNYRERGILFRLQATPLRPLDILSAQIGANFLLTTIEALLVVALGLAFYHLHVSLSIFSALLAYVLSVLSIFALGFLIASLVRDVRVVTFVGTVLFLVVIYLSGIAIPLQIYPTAIQHIAQFLPITHAVTLLQDLWLGASWSAQWADVLILLAMLVICMLASSKLFRWR